ncbi:MAG: peroxiredoxin [Bacteroidales bacterium]|nr:peroxiredoxin [Bacteroidales bacterium]
MKAVQAGDMIPEFSLPDQNGNMVNITDFIGRKKLVIFFYPRDGSHNCTKEACYFRDLSQTFDEVNAVILGISGQSVSSHKKFAEQYRLDYLILSDEGNHIRKLFGVPSNLFGMLDGRVTYVTDQDGKIAHIFNSQLQPERHVDEALKVCLLLKRTDNGN